MNISIRIALTDNGGRRSGYDRRQFSYTVHVPERRITPERRVLPDRRRRTERREEVDRRKSRNCIESLKKMMGFEGLRKDSNRECWNYYEPRGSV